MLVFPKILFTTWMIWKLLLKNDPTEHDYVTVKVWLSSSKKSIIAFN